MAYDPWRPSRQREHAFFGDLLAMWQRLRHGEPVTLLDVPQWVEMYARQAAQRMITGLMVENARDWREAAMKSMQGPLIYAALQKELRGPVGKRVRELIAENAKLIRSLPREAALQASKMAAKYAQAGERAAAFEKFIPSVFRWQARRLARTESSKAMTALIEARSEDLGIPAFVWETSQDERVRKSHQNMQGVIVFWRDLPSPEALIGEKSYGRYAAGGTFNCFTGDTIVSSPSGVKKLWRAPYSGDVIMIEVEGGLWFTATPNHPILTSNGWVAVGLLNEGDYLVHGFAGGDAIIQPHMSNSEASFEDLFKSATLCGNSSRKFTLDFYGDVINDYVDEITLDRNLQLDVEANIPQSFRYLMFSDADRMARNAIARVSSHIRESSIDCGSDQSLAFCGSVIGHADIHSLRAVPRSNIHGQKTLSNGIAFDSEEISYPVFTPAFIDIQPFQFIERDVVTKASGRQLFSQTSFGESIGESMIGTSGVFGDAHQTLPISNHLSRIVKKRVRESFSGHVYTLESGAGYYGVTAANIIAQNCRCAPAPLLRYDQVQWPHKVFVHNRIQYISLAAFRRIGDQREIAA